MSSSSKRSVIVTGATSGIGLATARRLASDGWSVIASGRNEQVLEEITAAGHATRSVPADLTKPSDVERLIEAALEQTGRIDGLVHAAGILTSGGMEQESDEGFQRLMDVNLTASWLVLKRAWAQLIEARGSAVLVSSVTGVRAFPGLVGYCVSKAAVDQLVRSAALDGAPHGVRVNGVNPGVVVTELHKRGGMEEQAYARFLEHSKSTHPLGRVGQPEEVAEAISWLLGETAGWITGVSLPIDGGRHQTAAR